MLPTLTLVLLLLGAAAQSCLGQDGQPVGWWVLLKVPPRINATGYGYYDSRMASPQFLVYDADPDAPDAPLGATLLLINQMGLQHVAWNDEKPGGSTSSTSAHSKGVIAYDLQKGRGFFLSHSVPKYPAFADGQVDPTIAASEQIYGQHLACFTLLLAEL